MVALLREIEQLKLENERLENKIKELHSKIAYIKNSGNIYS